MSKVYVGIDLGSKVCAGAVRNADGKVIAQEVFDTSESGLIRFCRRQEGSVQVLMEECDIAGWAYRTLLPHAQNVEVSEPRFNSWIHLDSRKGDPEDARKLSELLRLGSYRPVYHARDEKMVAFQAAMRAHENLVGRVVAAKNRVKALLRAQGMVVKGSSAFGKGREVVLATVSDPAMREILDRELCLLDALTHETAAARSLMLSLSSSFPAVKILADLPGVGPVLACRFVAIIQTPHRFSDRSKLWRYCRLGVTERESAGKQLSRKRLDPRGSGTLKDVSRKAFQGAMRTKEDNPFRRHYYESLARTGSSTHARLSTQRKILAVMWAMWRDGTAFDTSRA